MVGPTGLVMVPIIAARSHRVRPIFALPRRNVRCWHATLKLLTRRFKPLLAIAHKKAPRLRSLFFMVGPTGLVMVPIIAARSHRVRPIFALPRRNVRCWHATLKLLTRRFKPLLAIAHKKSPAIAELIFHGRADRI